MNLDRANISLRNDVAKHCKVSVYGLTHKTNLLDIIHHNMCIKALEYDEAVGDNYLSEDERELLYSQVSKPIAGRSNCSTC